MFRSTTLALSLVFLFLAAGLSLSCGDADQRALDRIENYLRGDEYSRLVLEVDYVDGYAPRESVEENLVARIDELVDKPDGVAVERDETITSRGGDHEWSSEELHQLVDENNDLSVGDDTIKMNVVFVDGHYEEDDDNSKILGLAWGNRNMAIFKKTLEDNCDGILTGEGVCRRAEEAIWTHELGHTLGLVANGVEPQSNHHDQEHGAHCNNDNCLMYWRYEGSDVFDEIADRISGSGSTIDFDESCREDLAEIRE